MTLSGLPFFASFVASFLLAGGSISDPAVFSDPEDYQVVPGSGKVAYRALIDGTPYALAASPQGDLLAMSTGKDLFVARFSDGDLQFGTDPGELKDAVFPDDYDKQFGYIRGLTFTPDGSKLAVGLLGGLILLDAASGDVLWHTETHPEPQFPGQNRAARTATYEVKASPDGQWLVTSSKDEKKVRFWSVADGSPGKVLELDLRSEGPDELAFSPDGTRLAVGSFHGAQVLDVNSGEVIWENQSRVDGDLCFSPDGKYLAGGGDSNIGYGAWIEDMDPETSADLIMAPDGDDYVRATLGTVWSPDGRHIFFYPPKGGVVRGEVGHPEEPGELLVSGCEPDTDCDSALAISSDGQLLAVADKEEDQVIVLRL